MSEKLYLNGDYVSSDEAKISVFDRGFMFGDGVYEVIPVYSGKLLRCDGHLQRLQHSLDAIGIPNPHSFDEWLKIFSSLIERNYPNADSVIYLQVTRGTMSRRDHAWSDNMQPNVLVTCSEQLFLTHDWRPPEKRQSRWKTRAGVIAILKRLICYQILCCSKKPEVRVRSKRSRQTKRPIRSLRESILFARRSLRSVATSTELPWTRRRRWS